MTDVEHAKKYAEESISLAISMYNPKAEIIAETACLYGLTYKNEQIAELEAENAELKGLVNQYKASKCGSISLVNRNMIMFDQLTKAKELLTRFVMASVYFNGKEKDLIAEAEQFINDSK